MSILKELHGNFFLVPVDKAANNLAMTCKRLHTLVKKKDLGFNSGNSKNNGNYEKINLYDIINRKEI